MSRSKFINYDQIISLRQMGKDIKEGQARMEHLVNNWLDYRSLDYPPTQKQIDEQDQRNFERLVGEWKKLSNRVRWMEMVLVELTLNSDLYTPKP